MVSSRWQQGLASGSEIRDSVDRFHRNLRYHAALSIGERLIALRRGANPLHGEVLEREEKIAQIASDNLDFVAREM